MWPCWAHSSNISLQIKPILSHFSWIMLLNCCKTCLIREAQETENFHFVIYHSPWLLEKFSKISTFPLESTSLRRAYSWLKSSFLQTNFNAEVPDCRKMRRSQGRINRQRSTSLCALFEKLLFLQVRTNLSQSKNTICWAVEMAQPVKACGYFCDFDISQILNNWNQHTSQHWLCVLWASVALLCCFMGAFGNLLFGPFGTFICKYMRLFLVS